MKLFLLLSRLSLERPIFHSEDDFKFALAQLIKRDFPNYSIRLEKPVSTQMIKRSGVKEDQPRRTPIDIVCRTETGEEIPIELKYKTKIMTCTDHHGEEFNLTQQGAVDTGRFGLRRDIYRVEQYLKKPESAQTGYVVMLTNDHDYLKNIEDSNSIDCHFSCHDEAIIERIDQGWNLDKVKEKGFIEDPVTMEAKKGSKLHWTSEGQYYHKLDLGNEYQIHWLPYSKIGKSEFKFCIVEVSVHE